MKLEHGTVLSYSAGSRSQDPYGFRVVASGEWMASLFKHNQAIASVLGDAGGPPIVINAYPATLGPIGFGVWVDTYMSQKTCARALRLAAREQRAAIVFGQPLFIADLLAKQLRDGLELPSRGLLALGGYSLPSSLERWITKYLPGFVVLQAYGVAEVDAACLLAFARDEHGPVWRPRGADVQIAINDVGQLLLARANGPWLDTGDSALALGDGSFRIRESYSRLDPLWWQELESWSDDDWHRRTGHLQGLPHAVHQLREGVSPRDSTELRFHQWSDRYGFSWLDKPNWSGAR